MENENQNINKNGTESDYTLSLVEFEKRYRKDEKDKTVCEIAKSWVRNTCSKQALKKTFINNFPFLKIMRGYNLLQDLPSDVISGFTVGIMQIPQGMAYANLATLPPVCGLYTSLFAPFIYFFFGSSKHASMGCIAVVSLMFASVLDANLDFGNILMSSENVTNVTDATNASLDAQKIQIASAVCLMSGLLMMLFGKLGLGFVTTFMSEYLIGGFTTGVAVQVLTSQARLVLGLKIERPSGMSKAVKTWIALFSHICDVNWAAVVVSVVSMGVIYLVKIFTNERFSLRLRVPIPVELFVVIVGTVLSHYCLFNANFDMEIVGYIPAGIPAPTIPDLPCVSHLIGDSIIIGIIAFAQSVSMAKTLALKNKYTVNANQEMFAYGAGSVLSSIFSGYIPAASVARSVVQEGAGGKTQVAALSSCVIVLIVVISVGPLFYSLPKCVLSAVILINLRSMFRQTLQLNILWKKSKYDFSIWLLTFVCTVFLNPDVGLGIGVVFSLITVAIRTQRSTFCRIEKISNSSQYRSADAYIDTCEEPGVVHITFNSPLYFANSEIFVKQCISVVGVSPMKMKKLQSKSKRIKFDIPKYNNSEDGRCDVVLIERNNSHVKRIVLDMSGVSFIDSMGVNALKQVILDYKSVDIIMYLVGLRESVLQILDEAEFIEKFHNHLRLTIEDANTYHFKI